jgi:hypothetical protein
MAVSAAALIAQTDERVRREPEFAGVLAALVEAPIHGAGDYTREAARALNRRRLDDVIGQFKADALPTAEVQRLLHLGTPQAVHQLRRRKRLLGLQSGNATWFPAWQFELGRLRPELPRILDHLVRFSTDPIAADRVMRLVREDLGGRSVSDALTEPGSAPMAWAILDSLGT